MIEINLLNDIRDQERIDTEAKAIDAAYEKSRYSDSLFGIKRLVTQVICPRCDTWDIYEEDRHIHKMTNIAHIASHIHANGLEVALWRCCNCERYFKTEEWRQP